MKKLLLFFVCSILSAYGQSYTPDPTFGTDGIYRTTFTDASPVDICFTNNQYVFMATNSFWRVDYNGSPDSGFGAAGFKPIALTGYDVKLKRLYPHNGQFYGVGSARRHSDNASCLLIVRLNQDGNYDMAFGTDGIIVADFAQSANGAQDIAFNTDGSFLITGGTTANKAFVTRFLSNGTLDTSFNGTGIRLYTLNDKESGVRLIPSGDDFLLAGFTNLSQVSWDDDHCGFLIKIDADGNYVTDFGTNGVMIFRFDHQVTRIEDVQMYNDQVFFCTWWGTAFFETTNLDKFNLGNTVAQFSIFRYNSSYFKVLDDGKILMTVFPICTNCSRDFAVWKYSNDGTLDLGFNGTGIYSYDISNAGSRDDIATVFYVHPNGSMLLAGMGENAIGDLSSGQYFDMLRLDASPLASENFGSRSDFTLYPNPASETLYIKSEKIKGIDRLGISDISGKTIGAPLLIGNSIDISQLSKGIYFLNIFSKDKNYTLKFIKL
jgi:uncharacterized delta-60 repeat protein